ncbi:MAG: stage V sporulation protein E [Parcubacteria group bacterium CG11_big_fil_rev_8_21_14_0_20_39_22]|nr:MAG: stage V sporulation protein E [Parcubacteria group bacterium CG11_big_fil_rev_8_21_14_0_20_39_22]
MRKLPPIDRPFLLIVMVLVGFGFFLFSSASLGLLVRDGVRFGTLAFSQFFLGIVGGGIVAYFNSRIPYKFWRKYSFYFFLIAAIMTLLVFVPGLGYSAGGARRWISLGFTSFQPGELLKVAFVIYLAAWFSGVKSKIHTFTYSVVPLVVLLGVTGAILLSQPDTGTFISIFAAGVAMFFIVGSRWRDISIITLIGLVAFSGLVITRPYIKDRVMTYLDPSSDPLGSSYQIQQSLIAIGSGGVWGRGFGQSIQKFKYLPEPVDDSIFAVVAEEFGFVGSLILVSLFFALGIRGLIIAYRAPDVFSSLTVVGVITIIMVGSFTNIASMLSLVPLSGQPLIFISHGGSALFISLFAVGIVLNISRYSKKVSPASLNK